MNVILGIWWVAIFLIAGMGYNESLARLFGLVGVMVVLVYDLMRGQVLRFPKMLVGYLGFLGLFFVSVFWSQGKMQTLDYWVLFASMVFVWLLSFWHADWVRTHFFNLMLGFGLVLVVGVMVVHVWEPLAFLKITPRGLLGSYSATADHFMAGDYWGVLLVMLIYKYIKTKKVWLLPLMGLGIAMMLFSLSRSALVGFAVAVAWMFSREESIGRWPKRLFWIVVGLMTLYMSTQKSLIYNRSYYLQAILGLFTYPFGVGMGNFEVISADQRFHWFGLNAFSRVTHSILLEFLAGMGVLTVAWWWWCKKFYDTHIARASMNELSLALVALVVDFVFNPTYFVTPMWWLFGVLLGTLSLQENSTGKHIFNVWMTGLVGLVCLVGGFLVLPS